MGNFNKFELPSDVNSFSLPGENIINAYCKQGCTIKLKFIIRDDKEILNYQTLQQLSPTNRQTSKYKFLYIARPFWFVKIYFEDTILFYAQMESPYTSTVTDRRGEGNCHVIWSHALII